jgi:hypothetical protein
LLSSRFFISIFCSQCHPNSSHQACVYQFHFLVASMSFINFTNIETTSVSLENSSIAGVGTPSSTVRSIGTTSFETALQQEFLLGLGKKICGRLTSQQVSMHSEISSGISSAVPFTSIWGMSAWTDGDSQPSGKR